ncbi:MAG: hypothetical protein HYW24_04305 [Candidatus Aenigmarchaeota archaeon]|nr:hypothetical protein [Candidatus Aenigmarchaeota archaeon]
MSFTNITKQRLDVYTTIVTNRDHYHDFLIAISPYPADFRDHNLEKAGQVLAKECISKDLRVPVSYIGDEEPYPNYKNLCFRTKGIVDLPEEELGERLRGYIPTFLQILLYGSDDLGRGANWRDRYELVYH